jgi:hypothetical protein
MAFHPQTDGLSERKNAWVEQYLRFLTSHQQDDWAHWLPIATAVHNRAVNATTKVAPIEAILGYKPRLSYHHPTETPNQTVEERKQTAFEKQQMAKEALNRMAHSTPIAQYRVDDKVWLEGKNLSLPYQTLKLAPKRHGPFRITKVISPVAYQLELPLAWNIHNVFHASLLTPYHETAEHGVNYTRPPPELIDGEQEYEVKSILNHRFFGRSKKLQYLVGWKGYSTADNTWEPHTKSLPPNSCEDIT